MKLAKETDESASDVVVYGMVRRLVLRQVVESNALLSLSKPMREAANVEWSMRLVPTNKVSIAAAMPLWSVRIAELFLERWNIDAV